MAKRAAVPLAVLLLCGGAGAGWYWWTELRFLERTDNAYVRGDLAIVSPRITGHVVSVDVDTNTPVKKGDVLLRIDDRDFRARVDEAEAALAAKTALVESTHSELEMQATRIAEAEATLASAKANAARARSDLDRYVQLADKRNASRQQLESAQAEAEATKAAVDAAAASLEAARDQVGVLRARQASAEAEKGMAGAVLERAKIDLDYTTIQAPIDGVVGNKAVQVGDYLKPGQQLMAVVPMDALYIEANFKETQIARMRSGAKVQLKLDAYPDQPLEGTIESFAPASGSTFSLLPPENASGNFTKIVQRVPVRIALPRDNPLNGRLRPGLSVVVTADTRQAGDGPIAAAAGEP
ncbi:MAG: HlyD family secretion protein [Geminicoccaceae bacterium]